MQTPTTIYNLIAEYELVEDERDAVLYGSIFLHFCRKLFPNCKIHGFGKSDPRKSLLFKCSYKMVKEVKGKIPPKDIDLYIYSQLATLKANNSEDTPVLLTPQILCGAKAEWRWNLFNKQSKIQLPQIQQQEIIIDKEKIQKSIMKSEDFLQKNLKPLSKENFAQKFEDGTITRWFENKFICGYYLVASNLVKECLKNKTLTEVFGPGISIYIGK